MKLRRGLFLVFVLLTSALATNTPAQAREPANQPEKPGRTTAIDLGQDLEEPFTGLDANGLTGPESKPRVEEGIAETYVERITSQESGALYQQLLDARDAGQHVVLSPLKGIEIVLIPQASKEFALPEESLLFLDEKLGEYVIFGGDANSSFGSVTDPLRRGIWSFESLQNDKLQIRLTRSLAEFSDDVAYIDEKHEHDSENERFSDAYADEALTVAPDGVDEEWERLSSVPDETWVYPNGERVIDQLRKPSGRSKTTGPPEPLRITLPDGTPVIDVAFMFAENASNMDGLSTKARIVIDDANEVMINSGVDARFRLAGLDPISRTFGTPSTDSQDLIDDMKGDGAQSDVADFAYALRINSGADVIVAIAGSSVTPTAGKAGYIPYPSVPANTHDSVVIIKADAIWSGSPVGPHELSHVVGGAHATGGSGETFASSDAFTYYGAPLVTLMNSGVTQNMVSYFSGPNVLFPGNHPSYNVATGDTTHDNARAVSIWDEPVASLKRGMYCSTFGTGHHSFVINLHQELTGRPGAPIQSVTMIANKLTAGREGSQSYMPRDAVIEIIESPDASRIKELVRLYHMMFNRPPDYAGLNFWLGQRWGSLSINDVANAFATSPEFAAAHGSQSDAVYVDSLFMEAFGTVADPAGNAYWVGQIAVHGRAWVAVSLNNWPTAITRNEGVARYQTLVFGTLSRTNSAWFENRHGYKMVIGERFNVARWHLDSATHHATC